MPVTDDYFERDNTFTGDIKWVRIDVGEDDHSHMLLPEARLGFLMSRQ